MYYFTFFEIRAQFVKAGRFFPFDPVISDHCAFHCNLRVQKPHFTKKKLYYRKLRSLDIEAICEDILTSPLLQDQAVEINGLVDQYDNIL